MLDETTIQETLEGNVKRNTELLIILGEKGVSLDKSREIEFHYWAWNQNDVVKFKQVLIQNGANVKEVLVKENNENLWSLTAILTTTPTLAASLEQTKTNVMLAAEFNCVYDGWGMRL